IVAMDLIAWQPLSVWAEKFRYEFAAAPPQTAGSFGFLSVVSGIGPAVTRAVRAALRPIGRVIARTVELAPPVPSNGALTRAATFFRTAIVTGLLMFAVYVLAHGTVALVRALAQPWPTEVRQIPIATVWS